MSERRAVCRRGCSHHRSNFADDCGGCLAHLFRFQGFGVSRVQALEFRVKGL